MKKVILFLLVLSSPVIAQQNPIPVPISYEVVTFDATAAGIGFTATTLTVNGQQARICSGVLETAAIRYRIDGAAAPSATDGRPVVVGELVSISGFTALTRFRGIRTTGTSGVIRFTCFR